MIQILFIKVTVYNPVFIHTKLMPVFVRGRLLTCVFFYFYPEKNMILTACLTQQTSVALSVLKLDFYYAQRQLRDSSTSVFLHLERDMS